MTANELDTMDGRYREQRRRAAEMLASWEIEDRADADVIDLREPAEVEAS